MSTRHQARRRKGRVRQVKYPGWDAERREAFEEEREEWGPLLLYPAAEEVRDYWRESIGLQATFVYFIQAAGLPELKIGYAVNPVSRLGELQCGNARQLRVRALMLGSKATERALHRFWARGCDHGAHVLGEWYGNGYEAAILEMADTMCWQQITDHQEGSDFIYVRDTLPLQIIDAAAA